MPIIPALRRQEDCEFRANLTHTVSRVNKREAMLGSEPPPLQAAYWKHPTQDHPQPQGNDKLSPQGCRAVSNLSTQLHLLQKRNEKKNTFD
jgi:hypothetical protein